MFSDWLMYVEAANLMIYKRHLGLSCVRLFCRLDASAVLGVVILSVRLLHECFVTKQNNAPWIFWYQTKDNRCSFLTPTGTPPSVWNLRSKWLIPVRTMLIWTDYAYNVSTIRNSEKVQLWRIVTKLTTCFPTSYSWSVYVTLKSPKGWLKSDFFCKFNFYRIAPDTKFLCVKTFTAKL